MRKALSIVLVLMISASTVFNLTSCLVDGERIESVDDMENIESVTDISSENLSDSETESESDIEEQKTLIGIYASVEKTEYKFGEDFTADGIVVSKIYSDDSEEIIPDSEYIIDSSAFNKSVAGEYTIIIKLESNETVTYEFAVIVLPIEDENDSSKWSDILWE